MHVAFCGQAVHDVAPVTLLYVPDPQAVHGELPVVEYVPIEHGFAWHNEPDLVYPVLQVKSVSVHVALSGQAVHIVAPVTLLYVPGPQAVHDIAPVAPLNFPAEQAVQVVPFRY